MTAYPSEAVEAMEAGGAIPPQRGFPQTPTHIPDHYTTRPRDWGFLFAKNGTGPSILVGGLAAISYYLIVPLCTLVVNELQASREERVKLTEKLDVFGEKYHAAAAAMLEAAVRLERAENRGAGK